MTETRSLHSKLAQVMYEAERIPKNGSFKSPGEYGHFKFVQAGDAADMIRKALAEHKVSMVPSAIDLVDSAEHQTAKGNSMTTVTVRTTWTLTDGDTGETAVIQSMGSGADTGDKAIPKAQTNAMKYALLMGFLLSTGDDPELSDTSDRRPRNHGNAASDRLELDRPVSDLIGTVEAGKPPVDMQLREDRELGPVYGFKLKSGSKAFQVLATGPLAAALSTVGLETGTRVTVEGSMVMVPWDKGGVAMPPFSRVMVTRVHSSDWTLPMAEAESLPLFTDAEAAEILEREREEALA